VGLPYPGLLERNLRAVDEEACDRAIREQVDAIAFGDLFFRHSRLSRDAVEADRAGALFPLWEIPTDFLAREMIAGGLRAKLVCVDKKQLPGSFAGRDFDAALLNDLPPEIDPVESAASFILVSMRTMFAVPVNLEAGEIVDRDGFVYADFLERSALSNEA